MKLTPLVLIFPKKAPIFLFCVLCLKPLVANSFELGYGIGSMGLKYELGHKLSESFNLRFASGEFQYIATKGIYRTEVVTITDILNSGGVTTDVKQLSLLFDYHPWRGDFRYTGGITQNRLALEVINYGNRDFIINNSKFSDRLIDSTALAVDLTNGVSPYFGIGWSTGFDRESGLSFSGDIGFYYAVNFALNFSVECTKMTSASKCSKIKSEALKQQQTLRNDLKLVILPSVGAVLSYKF